MRVPLPPAEEQAQIASHIDALLERSDALVDRTSNSIALLREHRAALITAAVTGQIDVRPQATPA
jgi:type I restriction enzyme S subunit